MAFVRAEHDSLSGAGDATSRQIVVVAGSPAHLDLKKPVFAPGEANETPYRARRQALQVAPTRTKIYQWSY